MPFTPVTKQPGDLARAQEWNEAMTEVVRLESAKVAKVGAVTITGPVGFTNAGSPMLYIYQSGTANPERPVIAHSPDYPDWGLAYRDAGDLMIFQRAGTPVMAVQLGSQRVGIGTTDPQAELDVNGTVRAVEVIETSDRRWKENLQTIPNALTKVLRLRGIQFEWRTAELEEMHFPTGRHIGLVAQEVEQVVPEVVSTDEKGYKSVAYANLVAVLVEAVKELQAEVESLKATLQAQGAVPGNGHRPAVAAD